MRGFLSDGTQRYAEQLTEAHQALMAELQAKLDQATSDEEKQQLTKAMAEEKADFEQRMEELKKMLF